MLGERLFQLITKMIPEGHPNHSIIGKITGMLLEIDNSELLHMLESRESLSAKVSFMVNVKIVYVLLSVPDASPVLALRSRLLRLRAGRVVVHESLLCSEGEFSATVSQSKPSPTLPLYGDVCWCGR